MALSAGLVLRESVEGLVTETHNFSDRDSEADEAGSVSPDVPFSHKLSDASTTAAVLEVVTAAPTKKSAEKQGAAKGKRNSRAANARGKYGPVSSLRSELRTQGQQIMKNLSMPLRPSKRQPPAPAKAVRPVARPAGKTSPYWKLPLPPGLEDAPGLGYSGFSGYARFGPSPAGTVSSNEQDVRPVPTYASASHFDEDLFAEMTLQHLELEGAHWPKLQNEAQEEMLVLERWSL
eukprot:TRINITY_DN6928_c0_g3_i1.p1 TRINITY_DN6928_c0_g3~~TRINITY_DN6928_c0_g3_i1.p1  ORF type:complete len:258 (+),score=60.02 TRINITY_DN6928_c0_g3_i1:75-776(+)